MLLTLGGTAIRDKLELLSRQLLGQLSRVGDRRGRADKLGRAAIETADSLQTPEEVGQVATEHAAVGVQLVDDHVLQVLEDPRPLRVVGEDPLVQHVGVRQDDVCARPNRRANILRRVPIIGMNTDVRIQRVGPLQEVIHLVVGERLGREKVQGSRVGIVDDALEDGQVVTQCLPRGGRRQHDRIRSGVDPLVAFPLVGVELPDASAFQNPDDRRGKRGGEVHELSFVCRNVVVARDAVAAPEFRHDISAIGEPGDRGVFQTHLQLGTHTYHNRPESGQIRS